MTNHINDAWVLALSSKKWGTLSEDQKKALTDASVETATFKTGYDSEQSKKQLDELTAKGMKVNELSASGLEEFKAASKSLYPQFSELIGKEFFDQAIAFTSSN
jgi:TRAP-type C4-dicarboxylate transport system substrate-binding protein